CLDDICQSEARQKQRDDAREAFYDFLSEVALGQTPIKLRAKRWSEMAQDGVLALLKNDNDMLRVLSKVGLTSSITTSRQIVLEDLASQGIPKADIEAVAKAGKAANVPFIVGDDERIVTVV